MKRGKKGLSTIVATLLIILLTLVAVGIIWVVVRNVIQQGAEQVSLGKFTLNLEIKGVAIDPAVPSSFDLTIKRNTGEGEIYGLKFVIDDGNTVEVVDVKNFSLKELEQKTITLSLTDISNASNIQKISVAPIFKLESEKEVTGDIKDEYEVPKSSVTSGGGACTPATCAGKSCGTWANGTCAGTLVCGTCPSGTCNSTGQCVTSCVPATCGLLGKQCGDWANGTCAGTLVCGTCPSGTCNSTGQCVNNPPAGSQIIADHTIVDRFDDIPQCYIDEVKKMYFDIPGESHATAIFYGILYVMQNYPAYVCRHQSSGAPEAYTTSHLRVGWTTWGDYDSATGWITDENGHPGYGEEDWWTNPTAVARTKAGLSYMNSLGVAPSAFGFGWCSDMDWLTIESTGTDSVYGCHWYGMSDGSPQGNRCWGLDDADNAITGNSVNLDTYLSVTQEYIDYCTANNIPTKVFFTTGPLNNNNPAEQEYQGWLKMERIRDYVEANNQILLDYADILSYNDDGSSATMSWNGHTFPTITTTNAGAGTVGHIGYAGALRLGKAVWWMMARIAGWDGVSTTCS